MPAFACKFSKFSCFALCKIVAKFAFKCFCRKTQLIRSLIFHVQMIPNVLAVKRARSASALSIFFSAWKLVQTQS